MSEHRNRFFFPEKFFRIHDKKNILAFFTFVDNTTGMEYHNWRIVQGSNGTFVGSPFDVYDPKDGSKVKYYDHVRPAYDPKQDNKRAVKGEEFVKALHDAAYAMYERKKGAVTSGAPASGAGPVDDDDDLPF